MSVTPMTYETQFFGFTPQTCVLRMYIAFQDHLFHMVLVVEEVILKKVRSVPHAHITSSQIRKSSEKFLSFMKKHFNKFFSKLEQMLLQMVLSIPKNVLLPEDKFQEKYSCTSGQLRKLQGSIADLELRVKAETAAQQALRAELEEQKVVREHLQKTLRWFDTLDGACREHGVSNLRESFAFLKTTSQKLQQVVQEVDTKSKKLQQNLVCAEDK